MELNDDFFFMEISDKHNIVLLIFQIKLEFDWIIKKR